MGTLKQNTARVHENSTKAVPSIKLICTGQSSEVYVNHVDVLSSIKFLCHYKPKNHKRQDFLAALS
jgi:hypothetical protein